MSMPEPRPSTWDPNFFPQIPLTVKNWDLVPFQGNFPRLLDDFAYITSERCGLNYLTYYTRHRTCAVIPPNRKKGWSEPLIREEIDGRSGYSPNLDVLWDARERGRGRFFTVEDALAEWRDALWGTTAEFVLFGLPDTWVNDVDGLFQRMHEEKLLEGRLWLMTFATAEPAAFMDPQRPIIYIASNGAFWVPPCLQERYEAALRQEHAEANGDV